MIKNKRRILLVGLPANFVKVFETSERMTDYDVEKVDGEINSVKMISQHMYDIVVFRNTQELIAWDVYLDIIRSVHGKTRTVILFDGNAEEETKILRKSVDLCLSSSKDPLLCFEYIDRLFVSELNKRAHDLVLSSHGINTFDINLETETVFKNSEEVELTHLEFLTLIALVKNSDKTLDRGEIYEMIYGDTKDPMQKSDRRIDMQIVKLRQKLGSAHIRSIRGRGYRWVGL